MNLEDQRKLAGDLDAHVRRLGASCPGGMLLFNALSDRLPDLRALMDAAGPAGMADLARQFPNLGHFAELLPGLSRCAPSVLLASSDPRRGPGKGVMPKPAPLPFRLQRAAALLAQSDDPLAADAQAACREVASRLVLLEETLGRLLAGGERAAERAREVLVLDWS